MERIDGSEEGHELHFQGFVGEDTRSIIVRHFVLKTGACLRLKNNLL